LNLKTFATEVDFASSAADKRSTIPILQNLLLDQQGGVMTITGTDLEVSAVTAFRADKGKLLTTVPTRRLKQVIGGMNGAESFDLSASKHETTLTAGSFSARIPGMSHESYPTLPKLPDPMKEMALKPLMAAIQATSHAISAEESRFTLNGSLLLIDAAGNVLSVATDGHRLSLARYGDLQNHSMRFMLPLRFIRLLPKLGESSTVQVGVDNDDSFFLANFKDRAFRLLVGRKLTGNFPDYELVLPKDQLIKVTVNREALLKACQRIEIFADERSKCGRLIFKGGAVTVFAGVTESGDAQEIIQDCEMAAGVNLEIGLNLCYVQDALGAMTSETVEIGLRDATSAIKITGDAGEGVVVTEAVMPMRI
jgi:DNA polymerase III subunit beta